MVPKWDPYKLFPLENCVKRKTSFVYGYFQSNPNNNPATKWTLTVNVEKVTGWMLKKLQYLGRRRHESSRGIQQLNIIIMQSGTGGSILYHLKKLRETGHWTAQMAISMVKVLLEALNMRVMVIVANKGAYLNRELVADLQAHQILQNMGHRLMKMSLTLLRLGKKILMKYRIEWLLWNESSVWNYKSQKYNECYGNKSL